MKKFSLAAGVLALCLSLFSLQAQSGPRGGTPRGPRFDAAMQKIFGENSMFSATMESEVTINGNPMTMSGNIAYDAGKVRFEMNMSDMKSADLPASAREQLKAMGMDNLVTITRPDKQMIYMIYPGMEAYASMPMDDSKTNAAADKFKVETTELGKETIDGHACVKNKVVVTDEKEQKHEFVVWNATDLKKFPVQIETSDGGTKVTTLFKKIALTKPAASQFELPANYKAYESVQTMMMQEMMKRMNGRAGMPPGH